MVALALSGGPRFGPEDPLRGGRASIGSSTASASPSAAPSPAYDAYPTPTASPSPSPSPTAMPALGELLRPLAGRWTPAGGTNFIAETGEREGGPSRLVAIPTAGATPVPIAALGPNRGWDLRRSGATLAVALESGSGARIATLDLRSGAAAYVTAEGVIDQSPVWSADGAFIYFGRSSQTADLGLYRVPAQGGAPVRVREGVASGLSLPRSLTPDGRSLVWSERSAHETVRVLDLSSGAERALGNEPARAAAWRTGRPRALVERLGSTGEAGALALWDDQAQTGEPRVLLGPGTLIFGADWSPAENRLVAATRPNPDSPATLALVTMDADGTARQVLPGTEGARVPVWLRAGVGYLHAEGSAAPREVRLVQPTGGVPPRTIYRSDEPILRLGYVSP